MMPIYVIDHLFSLCALQRWKMSPRDSNSHLLCPFKFVYPNLPWPFLSSLTKPRANCKGNIYLVQAYQFSETWQQKIGGRWKKSGPFWLLPCLPHHFFYFLYLTLQHKPQPFWIPDAGSSRNTTAKSTKPFVRACSFKPVGSSLFPVQDLHFRTQ